MGARVLVGDRTGLVRGELRAGSISSITWRLNKAGSATITIKRGATAFRRDWLEPGARVYVEFDNGLPAWGGILDLPRTWHRGYLEMRAHTIERLLKFSITPKTRAFYSEVVGGIFSQILQEADARSDLGITIGSVWRGGAGHYPRYHFRTATWVIDSSIRKMEVCDYRFVPYLDGNVVEFRAELEQVLGDDKRSRVALIEGKNITGATLTEQGDIVNRAAVVGAGSTWGEREVVWAVEDESRRRYGLREAMVAPADVTQAVTLNRYADNAIRDNAYPHTLADLDVADVSPARFADYGVGDIVRVILSSYHFDGYDAAMRIVARGYNPRTGECNLVCDERFEYAPILRGEDEYQPGEGT